MSFLSYCLCSLSKKVISRGEHFCVFSKPFLKITTKHLLPYGYRVKKKKGKSPCFRTSLRKGVNLIELSSSDNKTIQHQCYFLAKKTLKYTAKNYCRKLTKRAAREVTFSYISLYHSIR